MSTSIRLRLLDSGIQLFREQGYHGTGIQQIASAAGIPKGSFCYYFASKEDFAARVIARYAEYIANDILQYTQRTDLQPFARLRTFFSDAARSLEASGCSQGCTIGNLLAEIGEVNGRLREELQLAWEHIVAALQRLVIDAKDIGEISQEINTGDLAQYLMSGWEGALLAMRARRSAQPLLQFIEFSVDPLADKRTSNSTNR